MMPPPLESLARLGPALAAAAGLAAACACFADDAVESEARAVAVVERLHRGLIEMSAAGPDIERRYELIEPVVRSTHDLEYIAQLTVRRQWRDLTEPQRAAFVAAFAHLSIMNYASRFANVTEASFRLDDVADAGGGRLQVNAAILPRDGEDVPLAYTLQDNGGDWRIVNIFADGVSDLALKRAEYQRLLADGTIEDLIEYVNSQAEALR